MGVCGVVHLLTSLNVGRNYLITNIMIFYSVLAAVPLVISLVVLKHAWLSKDSAWKHIKGDVYRRQLGRLEGLIYNIQKWLHGTLRIVRYFKSKSIMAKISNAKQISLKFSI
jgi:hypothetical protein